MTSTDPPEAAEPGPQESFVPDAVLFDLDGTLVGSGAVWVGVAREVASRFARTHSVRAVDPNPSELRQRLGVPAIQLGRELFPELSAEQHLAFSRELEAELGSTAVVRGVGVMPGALSMLKRLHAKGLRLGVATNAGQSYLDLTLGEPAEGGLGLGRFIEAGRCLDSPRVRDKSDMLVQLMDLFGAQSGLMVGDTHGDARAAQAAKLPFVHFAGSGTSRPEGVPVEGALRAWSEFEGLLGSLGPR